MSAVDSFRQHLLPHDTSFIASSMNEPKTNLKKKSCKLKLVMKRVDSLEEVQVSLLVDTMCDEIQNMMFKRIFPQRFKPNVQRKVKDIEGIRN